MKEKSKILQIEYDTSEAKKWNLRFTDTWLKIVLTIL